MNRGPPHGIIAGYTGGYPASNNIAAPAMTHLHIEIMELLARGCCTTKERLCGTGRWSEVSELECASSNMRAMKAAVCRQSDSAPSQTQRYLSLKLVGPEETLGEPHILILWAQHEHRTSRAARCGTVWADSSDIIPMPHSPTLGATVRR